MARANLTRCQALSSVVVSNARLR